MDLLKKGRRSHNRNWIDFDRSLSNPEEHHWPLIVGEESPPLTHHKSIKIP